MLSSVATGSLITVSCWELKKRLLWNKVLDRRSCSAQRCRVTPCTKSSFFTLTMVVSACGCDARSSVTHGDEKSRIDRIATPERGGGD
jgi:hypothetical protein